MTPGSFIPVFPSLAPSPDRFSLLRQTSIISDDGRAIPTTTARPLGLQVFGPVSCGSDVWELDGRLRGRQDGREYDSAAGLFQNKPLDVVHGRLNVLLRDRWQTVDV